MIDMGTSFDNTQITTIDQRELAARVVYSARTFYAVTEGEV